MSWPRGLRARSAIAFALMALILSTALSVAAYQLTRRYLIDKREELALREASLNALSVRGQLAATDGKAEELVSALRSSNARAVLRVDDAWYAAVVQVGEESVPAPLLRLLNSEGSGFQRTRVDGHPYLVYGFSFPESGSQYFEFVSAEEYERTLGVLAQVLAAAATVTTLGGAAAGWFISRRLLRPLSTVAEGARSIGHGNLSHRLDVGVDPDLRTVATAFNEMAETVEARIEREHRFTADVSHELRTPLTSLGAAVSLAKRTESSERVQFAIEVLEEQLQHLTRLTVELLEISRIDSGAAAARLDHFDVAEIITRVLQQAGRDQATLVVESACPREWVVDGTRLERIIANLVENAARYADGVTRIGMSASDHALVITVDDAGPGVPEAERKSIFGRFNRGSTRQPGDRPKGTGLGLALVDEHVRLHGGTVAVTDAPNGGARFVVVLPRHT